MVVLAGALEQLELAVEVLLRVKRGAVDAGQHLAVLVPAPVGAGERVELERLDPPGRGRVRAEAEIGERAVAIERHGLHPLVADQVLDQLDLVGLVLGAKALDGLGGRQLAALERLVGGDVLAHGGLDPLQVGLGRPLAVGELEVVVEAAVDRRPDRDLRPGPQLEHRGRHHVRGIVADEPERVVGVLALAARGHDPDLGPVGRARRRGHGARRRP